MVDLTTEQTAVLHKLQKKARRWGGEIRVLTDDEWDDTPEVCQAPFTKWDLGILFQPKIVCIGEGYRPSDVAGFTTGIIHEMGHVFATKVPADYMPKIIRGIEYDEYDFFGWEFTLAKEVGLTFEQFCEGNADYSVGNGDDIGALTKDAKDLARLRGILKERVAFATKRNLIRNRKAVAIR